eukprot:gnl/MRDRNA2_/MRDRNA2_69634_c0_seq1.p1 gnl/MRDRNA2_/MRDRNA2_69634_c0~~gnl/MRDRNA2_/MRDRNA2_69634_c0_seq1.p1  ORF type:complete len:447 (-),score=60.36 gnl/MRDRNA2_/MRDRNA2_69634_c0_seq1:162-1502(-)
MQRDTSDDEFFDYDIFEGSNNWSSQQLEEVSPDQTALVTVASADVLAAMDFGNAPFVLIPFHDASETVMKEYELGGYTESSQRIEIIKRLLAEPGNWYQASPYEVFPVLRSKDPPAQTELVDLRRAHSAELVEQVIVAASGVSFMNTEYAAEGRMRAFHTIRDAIPDMVSISRASLTAVATVVDLAGKVMHIHEQMHTVPPVPGEVNVAPRQSPESVVCNVPVAFAPVRPAGHHSKYDSFGPFCAFNSVMIAALRFAVTGKTVGVYDVDVHFGAGTQDIAKLWNSGNSSSSSGRVLVADIYAALYDWTITGERKIENHGTSHKHGREDEQGHLYFEYDADQLTDDELQKTTAAVLSHFASNKVDLLLVAFGVDAGKGDIEGAQITPAGFWQLGSQLRNAGVPCVVALEGGYTIQPPISGGDLLTSPFAMSISGLLSGLTSITQVDA